METPYPVLQESDIEAFHEEVTLTPEDVIWNKESGAQKKTVQSLIIPIGYSEEQLNDPGFREQCTSLIKRAEQDFDPELYTHGLYVGRELKFTIHGNRKQGAININTNEIEFVKEKIRKEIDADIDMVSFIVNPDTIGAFHEVSTRDPKNFGYAKNNYNVLAGPYQETGKEWKTEHPYTYSHELMHGVSYQLTQKSDPLLITDYYARKRLGYNLPQAGRESELIKKNCLSEYFIEDPQSIGYPLPSESFIVNEALKACHKEGEPVKWYDSGLAFTNSDTRNTHRILSPDDGKDTMSRYQTETGKPQPPASPIQKHMLSIGAQVYLHVERRRLAPKLLEAYEKFESGERAPLSIISRRTDKGTYNFVDNFRHTIEHGTYRG